MRVGYAKVVYVKVFTIWHRAKPYPLAFNDMPYMRLHHDTRVVGGNQVGGGGRWWVVVGDGWREVAFEFGSVMVWECCW